MSVQPCSECGDVQPKTWELYEDDWSPGPGIVVIGHAHCPACGRLLYLVRLVPFDSAGLVVDSITKD